MPFRASLVFDASAPQPSQDGPGKQIRIKVALIGWNKASSLAAMKVATNDRQRSATQIAFDKRQVWDHPARVAERVDPTIATVQHM